MARQIEKFSDKFGSGGGKDGSPEEKFFVDADIQIDPEWKVIDLLRSQIETISDSVNANDAASGSYATLKKNFVTMSGSASTRITAEETKNSPSVKTVALEMSVDESNNLVISSGKGRDAVTWTIAVDG